MSRVAAFPESWSREEVEKGMQIMPGLMGAIVDYFIVLMSEQDRYQKLQNTKIPVLIAVNVELVLR